MCNLEPSDYIKSTDTRNIEIKYRKYRCVLTGQFDGRLPVIGFDHLLDAKQLHKLHLDDQPKCRVIIDN